MGGRVPLMIVCNLLLREVPVPVATSALLRFKPGIGSITRQDIDDAARHVEGLQPHDDRKCIFSDLPYNWASPACNSD
eukprot:2957992-Amphidinium_carterae.1